MTTRREKFGLLLGFAGVCLFAGTLPATRLAVATINPLFLTSARAAVAGCTGLLVLMLLRRPLPSRAIAVEVFLAGSCTILLFPLFTALAMMSVPASHGGVVLGVMPLATVAAAALFAHERPSPGFWLASAAGGMLVLIFILRHGGMRGIGLGDLYLIGSVISGALGYTFSGRLSTRMPGWEVISWSVVMFLPLAALATWATWPANLAQVPWPAFAGLAYVSFISQYSAFFVYNAAMAMSGVARIGQVLLLQPFVIVALSVPVNGERLDPEIVLFAAAVVGVVLIGQRMRVTRG
ncbi:MAG TPA: DMT family transporter [Pseudolabrys sp.]|nr:DMT family transporter [Pseudolabrys sp.]